MVIIVHLTKWTKVTVVTIESIAFVKMIYFHTNFTRMTESGIFVIVAGGRVNFMERLC